MASGQCDNILLATYFSSRTPILLAPAMDLEMYRHPTVLRNLQILINSGNHIIPAESGELASGLNGEGRMAEPETILNAIEEVFNKKQPLSGKTALVNAGPTYEPIDQVRFIGNRSSGKMGAAIAEILAEQGADVILVLGPSSVNIKHKQIQVISVETNNEMYGEMLKNYSNKNIVICSAAVSDYAPEHTIAGKIKKDKSELNIKLLKTKDILHELGLRKQDQFLVGFALETENLFENAREKLQRKNCDLMVANATSQENPAFNSDFNKVVFITPNNNPIDLGFKTKQEIASELVQLIIQKFTLK
jgi:phosphopantothenoylcysteine decarboxylase / phosphopantothenate---cysteine ligase